MKKEITLALFVIPIILGWLIYYNNNSQDIYIVVGGGAAGMSAALEIANTGSTVHLFDKGKKNDKFTISLH